MLVVCWKAGWNAADFTGQRLLVPRDCCSRDWFVFWTSVEIINLINVLIGAKQQVFTKIKQETPIKVE